MLANTRFVALAILLVLGPVGLRMLTRQGPPAPADSLEDIEAGRVLFEHEWVENDPLCAGGDGLGPVFNATSCVACHHQGGLGGSGGLEHNVTAFVRRSEGKTQGPLQGVVHAFATEDRFLETLNLLSEQLPATSRPSLAMIRERAGASFHCSLPGGGLALVSQRNTPALFGSHLIEGIPANVIIAEERRQRLQWGMASPTSEVVPIGRALRFADGRIGKFGWKAQSASLSDFVQAACAGELGLSNPGQPQPRPLGFPDHISKGHDLTRKQCDQITAFCASLPRPVEQDSAVPLDREMAQAGKKLFSAIGCANCHTPSLGSVEGIYSDLLLHRMGRELVGDGDYGEAPRPAPQEDDPRPNTPLSDEWRTPPLWGVADSAPYLHDGRAPTLKDAIIEHGGQASRSRDRFQALTTLQQDQLIAFLKTLRAPGRNP